MGEPALQVQATPFVELDRADWARLAQNTPQPLTEIEVVQLRGLGDFLDMREVAEVYLPLSRLLNLYAAGTQQLHRATSDFLGERVEKVPFIIGVAGSVAVGKSTVSRVLRELLRRWEGTPRVELVTTDGFLYSNAELERRGILDRKGFPESYDRRGLLRFLNEVKSGVPEVRVPYYSHVVYDIVPDAQIVLHRPDVLIVEGLNVLQPATTGPLSVSDFFDFSIYVDARTRDIANWFVERFRALQQSAFTDPSSYFHRFSGLTEEQAVATAMGYWSEINEPNLEANIRPTRSRAKLVLRKATDHTVDSVLLRKL